MGNTEKRESVRAETMRLRASLSNIDRRGYSKKIVSHLVEWMQEQREMPLKSSFNAVMVYLSMKSEVETKGLINFLIKQRKHVIAPVVDTKSGQLIPKIVQDMEELEKHRYGMLQPNVECPIFPVDQIELVVVPGIAFDKKGYRLGYGKGFYDRFLPTCPNAVTIGIAYQIQVVEDTYPQPWDVPVQHIFTENGIE